MATIADVQQRLVFSVARQDYRWADVVEAARRWGRWDELARAAAAGAAAVGRLDEPVGDDEVEEAARSFRYERRLLAAEEMEAWLAHWGVTTRQWGDYLRRQIALTRVDGIGESGVAADVVWAEAVCSGALERLARDLAATAAATEAVGEHAGNVDSELERMDGALAAFQRAAQSPDAHERALRLRAADWVRVSFSELELPTATMAREAALCVRDDGMTLAEVAARAGVGLHEREALIEELDPELAKPLLGAPADELVGPVAVGDRFALLLVRRKAAPAFEDAVIQERLEQEVLRRALEREVRNRVRWHERL